MIFRLSQKLNAKIKGGELRPAPLDANPLTDWSAHIFNVGRPAYILVCNTKSLYSAMIPAKGITNAERFVEAALAGVREMALADGFLKAFERFVESGRGNCVFCSSLNRTVLGSMNDLIRCGSFSIADGRSLFDVANRNNDMPCSPLSSKRTSSYADPREVFGEMCAAKLDSK